MISRLGRPSAVRRSTSLRVGEWYRIRTMTARWSAAVEAVAARRHPGRSRDGAGPAELGEGGFRMNPIGGVAKDDQHLGGGIQPSGMPPRRGPARVRPRRPALLPRVPLPLAGPAVLTWARSAAHRRAVSGPRPRGGAGGPCTLTRCRVARGGGVMRCAGRRRRPCGAADGLAPPAPAAPDTRRAGPRRRAIPAR